MQIEIISIFPRLFDSFLGSSLIEKALAKDLVSIRVTDLRDYAAPPHRQVDDTPYGGGAGMVLKPEPILAAVKSAKERLPSAQVILLTPKGTPLNQELSRELSSSDELIFLCGRYEGVDQRVIDLVVDREISIGDYVLMGGELPAMVMLESVTRLVPGVLGNTESVLSESFSEHGAHKQLLEAPHYTRPAEFEGRKVPEVLLSGDHAKIAEWREEQSLKLTEERRPDLLARNLD